ncbi:hypothetical protein [Aquipseudomonas alcaligenes]|uniref:hypothetical protein n=1 Tax=Aquipseudomonas alcaligenes TaxID=43263 RepID=UPI00165965A1|nr:hypothetical protein [Pseudomonas alcaligenes]
MSKKAVLVRLIEEDPGTLRVCLDDLNQQGGKTWSQDALYTFKDYDKAQFESLVFDEKELADFGYSIIARLYAFHTHSKK